MSLMMKSKETKQKKKVEEGERKDFFDKRKQETKGSVMKESQ